MDKHEKGIELRDLTPRGRRLSEDELALVSGGRMILRTLWTEVTNDGATNSCHYDDHSDCYFVP
jgi:hypothetical protein